MPRFALLSALLLSLLLACAKEPSDRPLPATDAARQAEIVEIESQIAEDRRALEDLITQTRADGQDRAQLHEDASLREIAARLEANRRRLERIQRLEVSGAPPAALP